LFITESIVITLAARHHINAYRHYQARVTSLLCNIIINTRPARRQAVGESGVWGRDITVRRRVAE